VVLSNADQHLIGAEIAIESAGRDVKAMYLSGGGAASVAIDAIREGRWDVTLAHFPASMGEFALDAVVKSLEGKEAPAVVNMDEVGPVPALVNAAVLEANPDFKGEWAQ
jgi:ribose transport system substrate-binding protein